MKILHKIALFWFLSIHLLLTVYGYYNGIKTMIEVGTLFSILSSTLFFAIVFVGLINAIDYLDRK